MTELLLEYFKGVFTCLQQKVKVSYMSLVRSDMFKIPQLYNSFRGVNINFGPGLELTFEPAVWGTNL